MLLIMKKWTPSLFYFSLFAGIVFSLGACGDGGKGIDNFSADISDSTLVLDFEAYSREACDAWNATPVTSGVGAGKAARAVFHLISTSCLMVEVEVQDSTGKLRRRFQQPALIFDRNDGEKARGKPFEIAWDGEDEAGVPLPAGRTLWKMTFRYNAKKKESFTSSMVIP